MVLDSAGKCTTCNHGYVVATDGSCLKDSVLLA